MWLITHGDRWNVPRKHRVVGPLPNGFKWLRNGGGPINTYRSRDDPPSWDDEIPSAMETTFPSSLTHILRAYIPFIFHGF